MNFTEIQIIHVIFQYYRLIEHFLYKKFYYFSTVTF